MNVMPEDYVKFKKLLAFFVGQANKNAIRNEVEKPVTNFGNQMDTFRKHYGLDYGYNIIAGRMFQIQFFKQGSFSTTNTTFVNTDSWLNICAKNFHDISSLALKIYYRVDKEDNTHIKDAMEELNKACDWYSVDELGLNDNNEPNSHLKKMLDQFIYMDERLKPLLKEDTNMSNVLKDKYIELLENAKNLILTGAPGTGKTYLAKQIAMEMIGVDDEDELVKSGQFEFVQFHPSYDYTDFVEGLRPIKNEDNSDSAQIGFELKNGIFKDFCEKIISPSGGTDNFNEVWENFMATVVEECESSEAQVYDKVKTATYNRPMRLEIDDNGALIRILDNGKTLKIKEKWCYNVYRGVKKKAGTNTRAVVKHLKERFGLKEYEPAKIKSVQTDNKKYIFIIDEINRGEISKIFGELFFSIDPGYRGEDGRVNTQYQNMIEEDDTFYNGFYVPQNVYIIGTMNDIDRSVESFDFAMRRRFVWEEITAKDSQKMLDGKSWKDEAIKKMDALNAAIEKIESLNSSYHIGAAYFLKRDKYNNFGELWKYHLKPLLKEYLRGMSDAKAKLVDLENAYNG